ncbi:MAG: hemolysin family protein [Cytophagaceae bacterium]
MILEILIILGLIIINGIFSMSEIALVSSRKSRLEMQSEEGNKGAKAALDLANSPNKFLSTVQVGITLIGILTGVYGGAAIAERISVLLKNVPYAGAYSNTVSLLLVVVIITYLSLVIGELVPKRLGLHNPEKIASLVARPMNILTTITSPIIWILTVSTDITFKLFRIKPKEDSVVSEEEIRSLLSDAAEEGEVEKAEHDIVQRVFFLGDRNVGSLMTNAKDLVCIDINDDFETQKKIISESIHTNFPVYEDNPDNIIGVLNIKKLVPAIFKSGKFDLKPLLNKPLFVPEHMNAFKLLENLKASRTHIAIVLDQYGGVEGAVTINDLFKALVGDLYTNTEKEIIKRTDGTWLADGLISYDEFLKYFEIDEDTIEEHGFHTLAGFILFIANKLPVTGEKFNWNNFEFEIIDMDGNRIDKVLIRKVH